MVLNLLDHEKKIFKKALFCANLNLHDLKMLHVSTKFSHTLAHG